MQTKLWVRPVLALLCLGSSPLFAGNGTWQNTGSTNANWNTASNWVSGTIPGTTSGTTNTDVAIFNTPLGSFGTSLSPIIIDSTTENIGGITFSGASGSYYLGSSSGSNSLLLTSGGTVQISNTLTSTNAIETINAPLIIEGANGTYTLANNSSNGSGAGAGTINFLGGITGGTAGTTVLTLGGSNTNSNTISGVIGNGSATSLGVTVNGGGTWDLSGSNTFSGGLTIQSGTIVALSSPNALGTGTVTLGLNSSSNSATLLTAGASSLTFANTLALASGNTGTLTIGDTTSFNATFSGGLTGASNITFSNSGTGKLAFSGVINNAGSITNAGTGSTGNVLSTGGTPPTASVNISNAIGSNVTSIVENGSSDLVLGGNNGSQNFTTTIYNGRIDISNYATGAAAPFSTTNGVSLAATAGNTAILNYGADLSNNYGNSSTVAGPISVSGAGTDFITATDWNPTYSGTVTLSNNLNIAELNGTNGSNATFTGGISGTGNITVYNDMALANSGVAFQGAVNNVGTITFTNAPILGGVAGTDTTRANTITGGVGSNVSKIINDSSAPLTISSGGISISSSGLTLVEGPTGSGTGNSGTFTVSSGITGTGNITLTNNGGGSAMVLSGLVNNAGTITNSGTAVTGTLVTTSTILPNASVDINNALGSNVTAVVQNGLSDLVLGGNNGSLNFTTTIYNGRLDISNYASGMAAGFSTTNGVSIAATSGNTAILNFGAALANGFTGSPTIAGPISVSGAGTDYITTTQWNPTYTGAISLSSNLNIAEINNLGSAVTFTGGVTGTGNITAYNEATAASQPSTVSFQTGLVNNSGTITFSNASVLGGTAGTDATNVNTITGGVGTNVTSITNDSTNPLTISTGGVSLNSGGLTLINGATGSGSGVSGTYTVSSIISGTSGVTVSNSSTSPMIFSGANTFTGGLTILAGRLVASTSSSALGGSGTGTVTLGSAGNNAATLQGGGSTSGLNYANPIVLASGDTGTLTIGSTGTNISSTFSGGIIGSNNVTFTSNSGTGTIKVTSINNTGTITNAGTAATGNVYSTASGLANASVYLSGTIGANVTAIIQNGPSDLVLGGNNSSRSFTTTINSGRIDLSAYGANLTSPLSSQGVAIAATSGNTAILNFAGDMGGGFTAYSTVAGPITVSGAGTDYITASSFDPTYTGNVSLSTNLNIACINTNGSGSYIAFSGTVTGSGNIVAYNDFNNANTVQFSGLVNNIGTITYSNAAILGGTASTSTTDVNTITGGVGSNVTSITNNSSDLLTISGGGVALNSGGTTFVNGPTGSGSGTAGTFTISSVISGTSGATVTNTSTSPIIFSGANIYGGGTTVTAGTGALQAGIASTTNGSGVSETITNGAFGTGLLTNNGVVDLNGNSVAVAGLSGSGTIGSSSTTATSSLTLVTSGSTTYSGLVADTVGGGTNTTSLALAGTGTQTLTGANTYSGGTTVTAGTLQSGIASTTSGSGSSETITNGAFGTGLLTNNGGTVDLNGNSVAVAGLSGSGGTIGDGSTTAASSLTLVTSGSSTYSGVIANTVGSGTKTTSLIVAGTGTQTLAGANIFSGTTTVNSGTLIVGNGTTGSLNNTSAINVNGGSLLFNQGATFNTSAIVTTNGTSTTPGIVGFTNSSSNSGATVTLGALSLMASSVTAIDFGTANNNTILFTQGTSAIGLTGSTVLDVYHYVAGDNLAFSGSATPNSNDLFTNVQFFSGAVGSSTSMGFGQEVAFGGGYEVVPTPEPSTIVVGLGLVGFLMKQFAMRIYRAKALVFLINPNRLLLKMTAF